MDYPIIYSPKSSTVLDFRKKIYKSKFNLSLSYMNLLSYSDYKKQFGHLKHFKDVWVFSNTGWNQTSLDKILINKSQDMSCGVVFNEDTYQVGLYSYSFNKEYEYPFYIQDCFMRFHIKRAMYLNCNKVMVVLKFFNKGIKNNIKKNKKKCSYFFDMKNTGVQSFNNTLFYTFTYFIKEEMKKIEKLTFNDHIIPLKKFEAVPVSGKYTLFPEKYGNVVKLPVAPVDFERLRKAFDKYSDQKSYKYIKERANNYTISANKVILYLEYLGFYTKVYNRIGINKYSTNELYDDLDSYIYEVIEKIKTPLFRQNISIAYPGWRPKWHRDQSHPAIHGFRLILPIDCVEMIFKEGLYRLNPGNFYFVNNSLLHTGRFPKGLSKRVVFMAEMASDTLILKGTKIKPTISMKVISKLPEYKTLPKLTESI